MKIRSKWGEVVCAGAVGAPRPGSCAAPQRTLGRRAAAAYMSMATTTLVRAAMIQAVANM